MTNVNWRDLVALVGRKWWVIALTAVCGAGLGAYLSIQKPPQFEVEGSFFVADRDASDVWRAFSSPQLFQQVVGRQGLQAEISAADLTLSNVRYDGQGPANLELIFTDGEHFQISDGVSHLTGCLGEPLHAPAYSLTLQGAINPSRALQRFTLHLQPTDKVIEQLRSGIELAPCKGDPQVFHVRFCDSNSAHGAQVVNAVMVGCEQLLTEQSRQKAAGEIAYLQDRQQEALAELEHLASGGTSLPSEHERVYLASLQEQYRQREAEIAIALAGLESLLGGIHAPSAPSQLNALAREVRALTHQRQALQLEGADSIPRLQLCSTSELACSVCGLDPEEMRRLFVSYAEKIESTRSAIGELRELVDSLDEPYFNISTLSHHLNDPVSETLITRASELLLILADEGLHLPEERKQLLHELTHFKGLLGAQLKQRLRSLEEQFKRTQEELHTLQKAQVDALDYHLVNLREELGDQVAAQQRALQEELNSLSRRLAEIDRQLTPPQAEWRAQQATLLGQARIEALAQLIDKQTLTQHTPEVASGVITPATPISTSYRPDLFPLTASGGAAGLLVGLLALGLPTLFTGTPHCPTKLRRMGLPVAGRLSRGYSHGSKLSDSDLEVLRNTWSLLNLKKKIGIAPVALLAPGSGPDFSSDLARLLAQQGERVLLIRCDFQATPKSEEAPGLVHYLKGKARAPKVITQGRVDTISAGGSSRYAVELLGSPRFDNLVRASRKRYGFVLLASYGAIDGAEVRLLRDLADRTVIGLGREPLPPYCAEGKTVLTLR